jgi:murein DD-endopeptidase MepM/ murein hydrolase activator NlpD
LRLPGATRYLLHILVVGLIGAAAAGSWGFAGSVPEETAIAPTPVLSESSSLRLAQAAPQQLSASHQSNLQDAPADNLLLAILALEASKTDTEREESIERIQSLGLPQLVVETPTPTPTATATPEPPSGPDCEDRPNQPAFCVYTVQQGDTISLIAREFGIKASGEISAAELLAESNKPDVISSDHIMPGQNLRIPKDSGIIHTVLRSETVSELAATYGTTAQAILDSPFNSLSGGGTLIIGQNVIIPNPTKIPPSQSAASLQLEDDEEEELLRSEEDEEEPAALEEEDAEEAATPEPDKDDEEEVETATPAPAASTPEPTATPRRRAATPTPTPTARPARAARSLFIWPVQGPISSYFGPSHPLGIDIDLYNDPNADIVAAREGEVIFAGGDPCCSYGLYVMIEHPDGSQTLYAHFSRIRVSAGQSVTQGQLLGQGGRTGYATGNHLHFEIRMNGGVVDPLLYLP